MTSVASPTGRSLSATTSSGALTVQAFVGDGCTLLAFDVKASATQDLAGFAIQRTDPGGNTEYLLNSLNFSTKLTQASDEKTVHSTATPSDKAPIQKFRWIDFPSDFNEGECTYVIQTMYFSGNEASLKVGDTVKLSVTLGSREGTKFYVGFTRGYLSSQAYSRKFPDNLEFRPSDHEEYLFDTTTYEQKWAWLGYHARKMLFNFLDEAAANQGVSGLDAFIYDVDEPDFVKSLISFGRNKKLRVILDDSKEKGKEKPDRQHFAELIAPIIGRDNVLRTHFHRFAHDKVLITKDGDDKAIGVLCGSANFSIRGLYVQGNSVAVIDDPDVAAAYETAFSTAWNSESEFASEPVANQWYKFENSSDLPEFAVSFAPHEDGELALQAVERRISAANNNVIFALMSPGGGNVIGDLEKLSKSPNIFTFGIVQGANFAAQLIQGGGEVKDGKVQNEISSFTALDKLVPEPFLKEFDGGKGQVIHHKFVVVDFNGATPAVYFGSSNLTSGGERENGDNLLAVYDREIATMFAIEGIRLADHYRFRDALKSATSAKPLTLQGPGVKPAWYSDYYTPGTAKYRSRLTLIQ